MKLSLLLLAALLAAGCQTTNRSNVTAPSSPVPRSPVSSSAESVDPLEAELDKLLAEDDAAQAEADRWIQEAKAFEEAGAGLSGATLTARIERRFESVRKAYEDFLLRHPNYAPARLAYGSFLNDIGEEDEAVTQWEKAREADPQDPAAWNNLANHYGHRGPVKKAFEYYEKAISIDPEEPVYLQNLATTTYLFRKDAKEFYNIDEAQVFDRALELYRKAIKLDPKNFPLATDYAQSFYGIRPLRAEEAIAAWNYALQVANDDMERQGVYCHLARVELNSGRFDEARKHLELVTLDLYKTLKERLMRNLVEKENQAKAADTPPPPQQLP